MRTSKSTLLLIAALLLLALFLFPGCQPLDGQPKNAALSATIVLDFSDPNGHFYDSGYRYLYSGDSYPASHKAWLNFDCPASPRFFAAYNNVDQTLWIAHCVEGIFLSTVDVATNGNTSPTTFLSEVDGGQEETFALQLSPSTLVDIENGTTQMTVTFAYQND